MLRLNTAPKDENIILQTNYVAERFLLWTEQIRVCIRRMELGLLPPPTCLQGMTGCLAKLLIPCILGIGVSFPSPSWAPPCRHAPRNRIGPPVGLSAFKTCLDLPSVSGISLSCFLDACSSVSDFSPNSTCTEGVLAECNEISMKVGRRSPTHFDQKKKTVLDDTCSRLL